MLKNSLLVWLCEDALQKTCLLRPASKAVVSALTQVGLQQARHSPHQQADSGTHRHTDSGTPPAQPKEPISEKADGRLWFGIGVRGLERVRPPGSCLLLPKHIDLLQRHLSACLACRVLVANQIRWASLGSAGEGTQAHSGTLDGGAGRWCCEC